MSTHGETLIVGAGQAGLALSRCLTELGRDHLVLERGRLAERWRSERWDSFTLLSPNWQTRLPGHQYQGPDPDGYMTREQIVDFFDGYARSFAAPVHTGVRVTNVARAAHGWTVWTDSGRYEARNVVIATGHHQRPSVPRLSGALPGHVFQLHTSQYRNPAWLPPGGVLVVGAGPSGQQIADELVRSGRRVHLSVGRHRSVPRRYRGQDSYWWMDRLGMLDRTVDTLASPAAARRAPSAVLTGGDEDLDLRRLVAHGVTPTGHLGAVEGPVLRMADDLAANLAAADDNARRFRTAVDAHVRATRLDVPDDANGEPGPAAWVEHAPCVLDLERAGIRTVVWATGFTRDYSWLHAPVLDSDGEPIHHRGVTAAPGLFFLGLRWQHRRNSNLIDGVGRDAAYLAEQIDATTRTRQMVSVAA